MQPAAPEWPSPQQATDRAIKSDETQPTVELAEAETIRAHAQPDPDALSTKTSPSPFARLQPTATEPAAAESSPLDEFTAPAVEATPRTKPTNGPIRREPAVTTPVLPDIALPTEETTAQSQESRPVDAPKVDVAAPHRLRAATALPRETENPPDQSQLFVLSPGSSAEISESRDSLADRPQWEDAPTAEHPRQSETSPERPAIMEERPELALNTPTEFEPPPQAQPPANTHGVIEGRVTDARTRAPLAGAMVRLVLSHDEDVVSMTYQSGRYVMAVPQAPDFFAISASKEGYLPGTANIRLADVAQKPATVDFALLPITESIIALEEEPDVHHLGNDRFEGRINSQFQKQSEGRRFRATFHLNNAQIDAHYQHAEVRLMAKGVQCPHQIRINGHLLRKRLDSSPRRGGFGRFKARFQPSWLKPGKNRFKITAKSCRGDLDDFEFVNVQIKLTP